MCKELLFRLQYTFLCFFAVDSSWKMNGEFVASWIFPLMGFWVTDDKTYNRYEDIPVPEETSNE